MTTNDNFEYIRNANVRLIEDVTSATTGANPSPSAVSAPLAG
jgi:hypothetical protein